MISLLCALCFFLQTIFNNVSDGIQGLLGVSGYINRIRGTIIFRKILYFEASSQYVQK
jgi:hypothetical protein